MPVSVIPSHEDRVRQERARARAAFEARLASLTRWLVEDAPQLMVHDVVCVLAKRLPDLALTALTLWSVLRLQVAIPGVLTHGRASYGLLELRWRPVHCRFGEFSSFEPVFLRNSQAPPRKIDYASAEPLRLFPHARHMGLAAGRMSVDTHILVADLAARMPFAAVAAVADIVGLWVPGPRAIAGIIDQVGPLAVKAMLEPEAPPPESSGTHVVVQQDDGGIPHVSPEELSKRRRPNRRRTRARRSRREQRRARRGRRVDRKRRRRGDKSKNCRMATVYTIFELRVHENGDVEGPLNTQVLAATAHKGALRKKVLRAAKARGWGDKPSIYLADGATTHWTNWERYFKAGTPCVDWYHVSEYLWTAAKAVFRVATAAPRGKRARRAHKKKEQAALRKRKAWVHARQDELLEGKIDTVLERLQGLHASVGRTGPGTRARRTAIASAVTYLQNHRKYLNYAALRDIIIGTGVVEGAIKQLGMRLKGSTMRWSRERSEHVLALRCLQLSRDGAWERFSRSVIEAHEAVTSLVVPPISPTKVVTAHKARRKAS